MGKPSERRFICGAALERIPIQIETRRRLPITGRAIISALPKSRVRPPSKIFTRGSVPVKKEYALRL